MSDSRRRFVAGFAVVATLAVGIAIGSLITLGVRAARPNLFASDASILPAPSPARLSSSFAAIAQDIEPAVVNINTETLVRLDSKDFGSPHSQKHFDKFFNQFFGLPPGHPAVIPQQSLGSGIILDSKGYILTNYHVVMDTADDQPVDKIFINLHGDNSTNYPARIVGHDKDTDLAVIKINPPKPLKAAVFGDSHSMRVGDWVLAVGSPFGLEETVTAGIISAKGRVLSPGAADEFKRYLQTDAAINPGNSGGPLVNLAGQVIGINTAIATRGGTYDGVGFAIPSDTARAVYNSIITYGRVRRGAIGVTFLGQSNAALLRTFGATHGVVIDGVTSGSPADRAGLERGDVILSIDGRPIKSGDELVNIVSNSEIGQKLDVRYLRKGHEQSATVVVADRRAIVAATNPQAAQPQPQQPSAAPTAPPTLGMNVGAVAQDESAAISKALGLKAEEGVEVTEVDPTGFAANLGIARGDVVLEFDHHPIHSADEFNRYASAVKPGQDVLFLVARRNGSTWSTYYLADRLQ